MEDFGKRLRALRSEHHITQVELAKKLGVTAQAVSKWEKGISFPDLSLVAPMAKIFRISTDQLLGYEGPRGDWEQRWQRAMHAGKPEEARRIAAEAQLDLPETRHFNYRQAQAEAMMARKTEDPEKKKQLLFSAERRLRDILKEYPEFESAALSLVSVLLRQGRRQEAEKLARDYPNGIFTLFQQLGKDAPPELKLRVVTARAMLFHSILLECGDLRAVELAERFLRDFPWDARDRAALLSYDCVSRAFLLCEKGDTDGAMAALEKLRELMRPVDAEKEDPRSLSFLRCLPGEEPSEEWVYGLGLLKDPRLKPLEGREGFRALLALAEKHSQAGGT